MMSESTTSNSWVARAYFEEERYFWMSINRVAYVDIKQQGNSLSFEA